MLSFLNTHISFYLTIISFLLCITDLAASAPTTIGSDLHRRHLQPIDLPFPYGKLADEILNVNRVSYIMKRELDEREEDRVVTYSTDHLIATSAPLRQGQRHTPSGTSFGRLSHAQRHHHRRWSGRSDFLAHDAMFEDDE